MALRIRIEHGQDAGKTYRLGSSGTYRFGRSASASVQVLDMKVSKEHFEVGLPAQGGDASIRDCGSSHGTLLNGQPIAPEAPRPLVPGDEIRLGLTVLRVLSDGPADAEAQVHAAESNGATGPRAASASAGASANASTSSLRASSPTGPKAGAPPPSKALPPDALVGTTLAGYRIVEKVGAGGMGAVYRAEQLSLHREVAIKVLAEKLVSDGAFVDQFVNEARSAGQLNHPNVVQVYDVGEADGRHFFSMEFIHGGTLESKIPKVGGGVPWKDALGWFLDAANALIFAEKKGILHRDIKPDNFMVSQDGSAKLCDLGLAKKSESADLLAQGIIGTPHFISPEAIRRKTEVDRRADLYSLGCTFYRVLTGKNPYPLGSVKEILLAHLNAPVPRASSIVADLPKEIDDVVVKLMQKDPAARYESAQDLWAALDKIRLQFGMESHGLNPKRAKRVAVLVSVLGVAAIGVAVYFVTRPPTVIEKGGKTEYVKDEAAERENLLLQAAAAFNAIDKDDYREGLEQGDNWKKPVWETIVQRYRDFAANEKHKESPHVAEATSRASYIERYVKRKGEEAKAREASVGAAEAALTKIVADVSEKVKAHLEKREWLEAEAALQAAVAEVDKQAEFLPERAKQEKQALLKQLESVAQQLEQEFGAVHKTASERSATGDAADLEFAKTQYVNWLTDHAIEKAEGKTGVVARAWRTTDEKAATERDRIATRQAAAVEDDVRRDRRAAWEAMRRVYGFAGVGGLVGGQIAEFRFEAARDEVKAVKARTPGYKASLERWLQDLERLVALPEHLKPLVGQTVKGSDWQGVVASIAPDSVRLKDGTEHKFRVEGVQWFIESLVYGPKGEERFPLSTDDHLALAILASAGGTAETAALFERASLELQRVRTADATRASAVEARLAAMAAEKSARDLYEAIAKLQDKTEEELDKLSRDVKSPVVKEAQDARDLVGQREKDLRADIAKARAMMAQLLADFPSSRLAAILCDPSVGPPKGSAYGGETPVQDAPPPPAPAPSNPPAPPGPIPPAPPVPGEPGMGDKPPLPAQPPTIPPDDGRQPGKGGAAGPPPTPPPAPAMGDAAMGEPAMGEPAMSDRTPPSK